MLAQQKLVSKQRDGAKVIKRYDRAQTPFERTLAAGVLDDEGRRRLTEAMDAVRPGELSRAIGELTTRLERLALRKAPAPVKPRVNRDFNASHHPELLGEATTQPSRRS